MQIGLTHAGNISEIKFYKATGKTPYLTDPILNRHSVPKRSISIMFPTVLYCKMNLD